MFQKHLKRLRDAAERLSTVNSPTPLLEAQAGAMADQLESLCVAHSAGTAATSADVHGLAPEELAACRAMNRSPESYAVWKKEHLRREEEAAFVEAKIARANNTTVVGASTMAGLSTATGKIL
jgi:hypothetical protein